MTVHVRMRVRPRGKSEGECEGEDQDEGSGHNLDDRLVQLPRGPQTGHPNSD